MLKLTSRAFRKCCSFWDLEVLNHSYRLPKSTQISKFFCTQRRCPKKKTRPQFWSLGVAIGSACPMLNQWNTKPWITVFGKVCAVGWQCMISSMLKHCSQTEVSLGRFTFPVDVCIHLLSGCFFLSAGLQRAGDPRPRWMEEPNTERFSIKTQKDLRYVQVRKDLQGKYRKICNRVFVEFSWRPTHSFCMGTWRTHNFLLHVTGKFAKL